VAGTYRDTLRSITGCDSMVFVTQLTVQQSVNQSLSASICSGDVYRLPSGRPVSTAGSYRDTLRTVQGCDSVYYIIDLQVNTAQLLSANRQLCSGQVFTLPSSGRRVSAAGLYADTLRSILGCDSLITNYTVTVQSAQLRNLSAVICQGTAYTLPSGRMVTTAGQYRDTLRSILGCDSLIHIVQLSVTVPVVQNRSATICAGGTLTLPGGRIVSVAGTYRDTLRSITGCDSMVFVTQLMVQQSINQSLSASVCSGAVYRLPSGRQVSTAGTYRDTLRTRSGCDSIRFIVNLSFNEGVVVQREAVICIGETYRLPTGREVNAAGVYRDTLKTTFSNCDSIVVTTLRSRPPLVVSINGPTQVCIGQQATFTALASGGTGSNYTYSWQAGGIVGGSLTLPITANTVVGVSVSDGCTKPNATGVLNITAVPLPGVNMPSDTSVMFGSVITLRPNYSGNIVRYRWSPPTQLSCTNCANPVATIRQQQTYTLTVENSAGCSTTASIDIRILCAAENVFLPNTFTPNADGVNDVWYPRGGGITGIRYLRVFNRWGQLVFERTNFNADDRSAGWNGTFKGVVLPPDVFVYSMGITCNNGQPLELKGNVMIVR
jgi:gliding motility-associated-like protein